MTRSRRARSLEAWAERVDAADLVPAAASTMETIAELAGERIRIEDELLDAVSRARRLGHSWAQIGAMLGVSKQAAQRKYADRV